MELAVKTFSEEKLLKIKRKKEKNQEIINKIPDKRIRAQAKYILRYRLPRVLNLELINYVCPFNVNTDISFFVKMGFRCKNIKNSLFPGTQREAEYFLDNLYEFQECEELFLIKRIIETSSCLIRLQFVSQSHFQDYSHIFLNPNNYEVLGIYKKRYV